MHVRIRVLLLAASAAFAAAAFSPQAVGQERPQAETQYLAPCEGDYVRPKNSRNLIGCLTLTEDLTAYSGSQNNPECTNHRFPRTLKAGSRFAVWSERRWGETKGMCLTVSAHADDRAANNIEIMSLFIPDITLATYMVWPPGYAFHIETGPMHQHWATRMWMSLPKAPPMILKSASNRPAGSAQAVAAGERAPEAAGAASACVLPSGPSAPVVDISADQAQYVVKLKANAAAEEIPLFEQILDDFVPRQVAAPFAKTKARFIPIRSLKYERIKGADGTDEPRHVVLADVPRDSGYDPMPLNLAYDLRIVATQRGIVALKPRLVQGFFKRPPQIKLTIAWDEIGANAKLKPTQSFGSFEELPSQSLPPMAMTEPQFAALMTEISTRLGAAAVQFDQLMIVKGDWSAPASVIPTLVEFADRKKNQGAFGYWLSFLSERTSANGNAYLKAMLEKEGFGTLFEAGAENESLVDPRKLHFRIVEEARSKAIREKKGAETAENKIVTDVTTVGETGHLLSREHLISLGEVLKSLSMKLIEDEKLETVRVSSGRPIQMQIEEKVPGFKVPKTAAAWLSQTVSSISSDDRALTLKSIDDAYNFVQAAASVRRCDRFFLADRQFGWLAP